MFTDRRKTRFIPNIIAPALLVVTGLLFSCSESLPQATLILKNGFVFTLNPVRKYVQALAIRDNRILAIGSDEEMMRYRGPETDVLDIRGRFVCPGFNDAHLHLASGAQAMSEMDLTGITSVRELQRRIVRRVRRLPPGGWALGRGWLVGRGWDQTLLPDGEWPNRRVIDAVAPDVPIFLRRICGHVALANSKALHIAGIDRETPDPPGGRIVRDERTGDPTGILEENAMNLVSQYIPPVAVSDIRNHLLQVLAELRRYGVTSAQDCSPPETAALYEDLLESDSLTCRISVWADMTDDLEAARRMRDRYNGPMLHFGMVKGFADGTLGSRTAALFHAYTDAADQYGLPRMTRNEMNLRVLQADREGFQIGIHAIGDLGNRMVLDAYELAMHLNGERDGRRHRIEHAQVLSPEDIPRFNELNVVASMQPAHCIEDMRWAEHRLGTQRCTNAYAWRSLKDTGATLAFGTDWPVSSLNPMIGLYAAVTRRDTTGYPPKGWFPQQRLTIEEAIEAYTYGSAYAECKEDEKGTLSAGMLADLVVLDRNLLKVPPLDILDAQVIYTILDGKIVYEIGRTENTP